LFHVISWVVEGKFGADAIGESRSNAAIFCRSNLRELYRRSEAANSKFLSEAAIGVEFGHKSADPSAGEVPVALYDSQKK
jgi:hypothetical protein